MNCLALWCFGLCLGFDLDSLCVPRPGGPQPNQKKKEQDANRVRQLIQQGEIPIGDVVLDAFDEQSYL